jgi:hypothetical protein
MSNYPWLPSLLSKIMQEKIEQPLNNSRLFTGPTLIRWGAAASGSLWIACANDWPGPVKAAAR